MAPILIDQVRPSKWGAKSCELCDDEDLAASGVCIKCDAGMCSTHFHVTCAQRHGLLIEDNSSPDTFYAHCNIHGDKLEIKKRVCPSLHRVVTDDFLGRICQADATFSRRGAHAAICR